MLWFDVELPKETTSTYLCKRVQKLWFDVEHPKETTGEDCKGGRPRLWFDVAPINLTNEACRNYEKALFGQFPITLFFAFFPITQSHPF